MADELVKMPPFQCVCGRWHDRAATPDGRSLQPGTLTLCVYCGVWQITDDHSRPRPLTETEIAALSLEQVDTLTQMTFELAEWRKTYGK